MAIRPSRIVAALAALALSGCFTRSDEPDDTSTERESDRVESPAEDAADYEVLRGDTLYGIAFRRHVDWRDLAAWNAIAAPYTIFPGQRLRLAERGAPVRQAEPSRAEPVATRAPRETDGAETFAVGAAGDTPPAPERSSLESAVRDAPRAQPAKAERAAEPMPPPSKVQVAASTAPDKVGPPQPPQPAAPASPPPIATAAPVIVTTPPPAIADTPVASREVGGIAWRWPAKGSISQRFLPGDPSRQGMNLQTRPGTSVAAAADGEVVYSGNGLVGYGELIIVKHSGEFLSAYGGSGKRLVAEGAKVKAGVPIAEIGGTGIVHFEIRRAGKPIDPATVLPPR